MVGEDGGGIDLRLSALVWLHTLPGAANGDGELLVTYSLVYVGENDYLALFYSRSEYLSL